MSSPQHASRSTNAYITLLTRPTYLAGAILLAYTLHKHSPDTPLIITYTPETLPSESIQALEAEEKHSNILLHPVEHLRLPSNESGDEGVGGMVAERFIDTWSKLRVFDIHSINGRTFDRICWLDADMMVFSDPSPLIFSEDNDSYLLSETDEMRLMAVHTCVCNLDHDAWAPESWNPSNCAIAKLKSPEDIAEVKSKHETLGNFNSGTFLYHPSPALSTFVRNKFAELGPITLRAMKFPDQDFLNVAFDGNWKSLSWKTNALKTWRYWHPNIWSNDNDVAVLHYIVDKPWAARVSEDGKAGYLGKDGETHGWWWAEFERWRIERSEQGERELLSTVGKYVAGENGVENVEMRAVGGGAQGFAKRWEKETESKSEARVEGNLNEVNIGEEGGGDSDDKPVIRRGMLGERGHGPVVRGTGRGIGRGIGRGEGWSVMEA